MSSKTPIFITRSEQALSGSDVLDSIESGDTVILQQNSRTFEGTAESRTAKGWIIRSHNGLSGRMALNDHTTVDEDGVEVDVPSNVISVERGVEG